MTKQEVVLDLLEYIGVYGFGDAGANSLNENSSDETDIVKAVAAVNAAVQEIYRDGPEILRHDKRAQYFYEPTPIVLAATKGSKTVTATTAPPAWMKGCSIIVAGDSDLNEITGLGTSNTMTLLRAYTGTTNSGLLSTVYNDAAILDKTIIAMLEPVEITPNIRLIPAQSRAHFDHLAYMRQDYQYGCVPSRGYYTSGTNKQVGMPTLYLATEQIAQQLVLRLNPMPPSGLNVTFHCNLAPETIVREDDLDEEDDSSDPGTLFTSIPDWMVESILLPIARGKFLSHPALKNSAVAPVLQADYIAAKTSLITKPARSIHTTRARYT